MDVPFLLPMLLLKPPSVDTLNTQVTIMVFTGESV